MEDYYSVLSVSKTATEAEIRAAYRRQAMATYPHLGLESEGKFEEIALAYITLSDPTRRQGYDDFLSDVVATAGPSGVGFDSLRMYHRGLRAYSLWSADDLFFMEMCSAVELTMAEPIRWSRQAEIKTAWRCPIDYQVRSAIEHYCQKGMPGVWEHLTRGRSDCPPHIERRVYNELETYRKARLRLAVWRLCFFVPLFWTAVGGVLFGLTYALSGFSLHGGVYFAALVPIGFAGFILLQGLYIRYTGRVPRD